MGAASAGDAGGALGAALTIWHHYLDRPRKVNGKSDNQSGSYLGPGYSKERIKSFLDENSYSYREYPEEGLSEEVAERLEKGDTISPCFHQAGIHLNL